MGHESSGDETVEAEQSSAGHCGVAGAAAGAGDERADHPAVLQGD